MDEEAEKKSVCPLKEMRGWRFSTIIGLAAAGGRGACGRRLAVHRCRELLFYVRQFPSQSHTCGPGPVGVRTAAAGGALPARVRRLASVRGEVGANTWPGKLRRSGGTGRCSSVRFRPRSTTGTLQDGTEALSPQARTARRLAVAGGGFAEWQGPRGPGTFTWHPGRRAFRPPPPPGGPVAPLNLLQSRGFSLRLRTTDRAGKRPKSGQVWPACLRTPHAPRAAPPWRRRARGSPPPRPPARPRPRRRRAPWCSSMT